MSWLSNWATTNGLSKGENLRSALTGGVSNFVGPNRKALTIKNLADPQFRGIASDNKYERIAGGLTAAIFGAYGLGALGGGSAAAEGGVGATDLGGFGGGMAGAEGGGFTGAVAPDPTEGFTGAGGSSSSSPFWKQLMRQNLMGGGGGGGGGNNSYQQMKLQRQIQALQDPNYTNYGITDANKPAGY